MGGNLLLSLWTASKASICMATMPVGHNVGSATICTHTQSTWTSTRCNNHSVYLQILRPFNMSVVNQLRGLCCCSWAENTHMRGFLCVKLRELGQRHSVNVPGIMLCRLLMCSWVTPLSVHTLSMKRATNLTTELATSLFSESSKPLSVSKLSATLPAML